MATPAQTVEALVKLGVIIHTATTGTNVDWKTYVESADYANVKFSVEALLGCMTKSDQQATIDAASQKQKALIGTGTLADLSIDKLLQFSALGRLKLQLSAQEADSSNLGNFGNWLGTKALPVLLDVAPMVIPLLL